MAIPPVGTNSSAQIPAATEAAQTMQNAEELVLLDSMPEARALSQLMDQYLILGRRERHVRRTLMEPEHQGSIALEEELETVTAQMRRLETERDAVSRTIATNIFQTPIELTTEDDENSTILLEPR